jgi:pimeloyl-ACP methyl ester carboxylesterase
VSIRQEVDMHRSFVILCALLCACAADAAPAVELAATRQPLTLEITRERVTADVWHHTFLIRVGDTPNARLRIHRYVRERAPFIPRRTTSGVLLNPGDFATVESNFAPMATWLAQRGIDAWGLDRRATVAPRVTDFELLADFDAMGLDQTLDDIGVALAFARGMRLVTAQGFDRLTYVGFSRGGQLGYYYAAREGALPQWQRHLKGLVPLDVFASVAPEDEDVRQRFCTYAADEYFFLSLGFVESDNGFQADVGALALSAPGEPTPYQGFFPGYTNDEVFREFLGLTYFFFTPTEHYHLAAPSLTDGFPAAFHDSDRDRLAEWLAAAPPYSSMREAADTDAMVCGDDPPLPLSLGDIEIPLLAILARGGYGENALHSTTEVGSSDVTTLVISTRDDVFEDFGHADLLFGRDAATLAWQPLLDWLSLR